MAKVHVCNVLVLSNPAKFDSKLEFEITFECIEDLPEDLEWKIIYVGSAESEEFDQILDTVYVGPVPEGRHKFVFTADPPDPQKIPVSDVVGVTVILLTCSYRAQEFIRVGYYVSNDYTDPEMQETPPEQPDFDKLQRNILASNPRVTKFKINWENPMNVEMDEDVDEDAGDAHVDQMSDDGEMRNGSMSKLRNPGEDEEGQENRRPPPKALNPMPPFKHPVVDRSPIKGFSFDTEPMLHNHNSNSDNLMNKY